MDSKKDKTDGLTLRGGLMGRPLPPLLAACILPPGPAPGCCSSTTDTETTGDRESGASGVMPWPLPRPPTRACDSAGPMAAMEGYASVLGVVVSALRFTPFFCRSQQIRTRHYITCNVTLVVITLK